MDSSDLPSLNSSAALKLVRGGIVAPIIMRTENGVYEECDYETICFKNEYWHDGESFIFNVSRFTTYNISGNSFPEITINKINATSLNNYTTDNISCNFTDTHTSTHKKIITVSKSYKYL